MPGKSLTNKPVSEEMKESSYMIVSQDEDVNGETKQALRKIPVSVLSKYLGVDELKKLTDLIPLGNGDAYSIGYEEKISASLMDTAGSYIAVDNEYAFCAYYSNVGSYVGETVYVSGACSQTYPLYVFKDVDGIVIDMGWGAGTEELTVVEDYAVTVPEDAATMYINQLRGHDFSPCVTGYFPKMEVGEENLAEDVVEKINSAAVKKEVNSAFSNALKGTASGAIVALDDVSPVEHEVSCTVRSKNLLKYPYYQTTKTQDGVTFTDNGDGSITVNGTNESTRKVLFSIASVSKPIQLVPQKKYTFSVNEEYAGRCGIQIQGVADDGTRKTVMNIASITKKTFTSDYVNHLIFITVSEGASIDNLTIYPQLEEGTESTEWVPYVAPESVTLSRYGKNIVLEDNMLGSKTTAWGFVRQKITLPAGKYVVSTKFKQTGYVGTVGLVAKDTLANFLGSSAFPTSTTETGALSYSFELTERKVVSLQFYVNATTAELETEAVCEFTNVQLEVDNGTGLPTAFEAITKTDYTPNANGTVDGVTSLAPNMTLMTDTENTYMDVEYNRDINKAFEEMYNAIISLGGSI